MIYKLLCIQNYNNNNNYRGKKKFFFLNGCFVLFLDRLQLYYLLLSIANLLL